MDTKTNSYLLVGHHIFFWCPQSLSVILNCCFLFLICYFLAVIFTVKQWTQKRNLNRLVDTKSDKKFPYLLFLIWYFLSENFFTEKISDKKISKDAALKFMIKDQHFRRGDVTHIRLPIIINENIILRISMHLKEPPLIACNCRTCLNSIFSIPD